MTKANQVFREKETMHALDTNINWRYGNDAEDDEMENKN